MSDGWMTVESVDGRVKVTVESEARTIEFKLEDDHATKIGLQLVKAAGD